LSQITHTQTLFSNLHDYLVGQFHKKNGDMYTLIVVLSFTPQ